MISEFLFILKGFIVGISVSIPLGPIAVLCIQRNINKGFKSGIVSGFGAALGDTFYAIITGFGLTIISNFLTKQQAHLRIIGSIFLLYLGLRIFFSNPIKQIKKQNRSKQNLLGDFVSTFLLTISNPFTFIFFGAVFAGLGLVDEKSEMQTTVLLITGILSGTLIWWGILNTIINIFRYKIRLRTLWWINKITGSLIVLLGIGAIISLFYMK